LYFSFKSLGYCLIVALGLRIVFRSIRSWTGRRLLLCHQGATTGSYGPSLRRRRSSSSSSSSSYLTSSSSGCYWMLPAGRAAGMLVVHCLFLVGAVLLAVTFATKTWTRNFDWADRRTLFEQVLLIQSSSRLQQTLDCVYTECRQNCSGRFSPVKDGNDSIHLLDFSLFSFGLCIIWTCRDLGWHSAEYAEL
jgi:hypothetical protein